MKPKLTEWFGPKVKPTKVGFYERRYGSNACNDFWDGRQFIIIEESTRRKVGPALCELEWRGLAEDPDKEGA